MITGNIDIAFEAADQPRRFRGIWLPADIWLHPELSMAEKVMLAEIDSLDAEKGCFASNEYFARFFGVSERRIQQILSRLVDLGFISSETIDGRRVLRAQGVKDISGGGRNKFRGGGEINFTHITKGIAKNRLKPPSESGTDSPGRVQKEASDRGFSFADWFRTFLPDDIRLSEGWREKWAKTYDDMIRLDKRTDREITSVCRWARNDEFWKINFLSPVKLRKRDDQGVMFFDRFLEKSRAGKGAPAEFNDARY